MKNEKTKRVLSPVDLHVHSNESDGTVAPADLVKEAKMIGLSAFALTDHDTTAGLDEAIACGKTEGVEVVPGIELSTSHLGKDIHVLGYYIDYYNEEFQERLKEFRDSRDMRNEEMFKRLRECGFEKITTEALLEAFDNPVITRAHVAKFMLDCGYVKSREEVFQRYIGDNCPCYVERKKISPSQAVKLILEFGGIPVMAHPLLYKFGAETLDALVASLKADGLMGMEVIYSTYNSREQRKLKDLAKKYDLVVTGGSDYHGTNKKDIKLGVGMGNLFVPVDCLDNIKKLKNKS
ncbi:MAG: PHP domain-containing protein [Lachnospiraceae bacterium]|nr:PHP domain-containing protein [Lachnospiraceae bacterium]